MRDNSGVWVVSRGDVGAVRVVVRESMLCRESVWMGDMRPAWVWGRGGGVEARGNLCIDPERQNDILRCQND